MPVVLSPGPKTGTVTVPSSKSRLMRLLLLSALGEKAVTVSFRGLSEDVQAMLDCLAALGAGVEMRGEDEVRIIPIRGTPEGCLRLPCGESAAVLRLLLPAAGALGAEICFQMEGRLPARPLWPLDELLRQHGMSIRREGATLYAAGKLRGGAFSLPGNISSQFVSGLLLALPLLEEDSVLTVTEPVESVPYIRMTEKALREAGIRLDRAGWRTVIRGGQRPQLPLHLEAEGDWSAAAPFLCVGALSRAGVTVTGLDPASVQGDRAILALLRRFGASVEERPCSVTVSRGKLKGIALDAAQIPDLIPPVAALAAAAHGETRITGAARLRLKESDRLESVAALLRSLGGRVTPGEDSLTICGGPLAGGEIHPRGDHRVAMAAAVAACAASAAVTIRDSACVAKSYPRFWEDLAALKGEET